MGKEKFLPFYTKLIKLKLKKKDQLWVESPFENNTITVLHYLFVFLGSIEHVELVQFTNVTPTNRIFFKSNK